MKTRFGILDFVPRENGLDIHESFNNTVKLAQQADELGIYRYWIGEHHSTPALLSSSPLVVLSRIAASTKQIQIGSGGVMLDNISSFQVAENFKVLQAMYPNRIEAGVGHSSPTEKATQKSNAVKMTNPRDYPTALIELADLLQDDRTQAIEGPTMRAMPTVYGPPIPMHILMTSRRRAKIAAERGLGLVFGLYLKPDFVECLETIKIYRENFKASEMFKVPSVTVAVFGVSSKNTHLIPDLERSLNHWIVSFNRNKRSVYQLLETAESFDYPFSAEEEVIIEKFSAAKVVGTPKQLESQFTKLKEYLGNDDFLVVNQLPSYTHRKQLVEIIGNMTNK